MVEATSLPLLEDMSQFKFIGAFKMNGAPRGDSKLSNSEAIIDIDVDNNRFFITSHTGSVSCFLTNPDSHAHSIAELAIPELVKSTELSALNEAVFIQDFTNLLDFSRISTISVDTEKDPYNSDCMDRITGIKYFKGSLILNTMEYYDAHNNNIDSALLIQNAKELKNSPISGFFQVQGSAHTARWISEIPPAWQKLFEGEYIFGNGNNYPINARQSLGPSAFVVDLDRFSSTAASTSVPSTSLIDYELTFLEGQMYPGIGSYHGALHKDFFNVSGENKLWTEKSKAVFGFIVPGTSTYAVIGSSGGHNSRICYKNTYSTSVSLFNSGEISAPDDGCKTVRTLTEFNTLPSEEQVGIQVCGGYCIVDPDDFGNYYWLFDVNDMLKVKNGELHPAAVRPYATGEFFVPFQQDIDGNPEFHPVASGSFDSTNNILYLTVFKAGPSTDNNNRAPVMIAFRFDISDLLVLSNPPARTELLVE
jgi:hypothetical protein